MEKGDISTGHAVYTLRGSTVSKVFLKGKDFRIPIMRGLDTETNIYTEDIEDRVLIAQPLAYYIDEYKDYPFIYPKDIEDVRKFVYVSLPINKVYLEKEDAEYASVSEKGKLCNIDTTLAIIAKDFTWHDADKMNDLIFSENGCD